MSTIAQQIVGELITHEKYTFVDGKLIYAIVNDAMTAYEGGLNTSCVLNPKDKRALQEFRDFTHVGYQNNSQSILVPIEIAQRISRLLNHNVRS